MIEEEKTIETLKELTRWRGLNIEIRDYEIDAIEILIYLYTDYKDKSENLLKQLHENNEEYIQVCNELRELKFKYQARKDRTKQENADLTSVYINGVYDGEKKLKDKIKEKITYYEDLIKTNPKDEEILRHIIQALNEILEESEE